jgi:hypothetical protein
MYQCLCSWDNLLLAYRKAALGKRGTPAVAAFEHRLEDNLCDLRDDLLAALRPRGLPIGNLTSQFWANCYLNPFDHFVKRELRCPGYVRYVDDMLLFGDDKRQLWEWKQAVVGRLARLRLTIHPAAQPRPVTEGIPFLGFIVFPERRRLKRRNGVNFARRSVLRNPRLVRTDWENQFAMGFDFSVSD